MAGKYKVQIKNNDGTMSDLPLVATYDSGGNNIAATYAKKTEGIYYIKGTGTTAGTWTGRHADITAYYDGLTIAYHTNIAGASTTTLNINGLGAKTCYLRGTTKVTTHYGVNTVIMFTYITVSGTGRWVTSDYDANSYAYLRQYFETANSELPLIMSHTVATSSDSDSYKTAYGGVVEGVTLNPSTKTISATAFKENGTTLADKYVAQVSGKGLSTNDYTTAEKTNLGKAVLTDNAQTITGVKTFNANAVIGNGKTLWFAKTGGTSQSGAANIKWDTTGNNAPYIGYATDQTDGTFVIASLKGTNYASGLAIGGGSGNLLWKGSKVITISDTATTSTAGAMSASDKSKLNGIATGANNYSLPAATSSTLGGVKIGANITNSAGTISLAKYGVEGALGYTPAPATSLDYKANIYKTASDDTTYTLTCAETLNNFSQTMGPAYGPTVCGVITDVNGGTNTGFILYSTDGYGSCDLYYSNDLANRALTIQVYAYGGQFVATVENSGIPTTVKSIEWDLDAFASEYFTNITLIDLNTAFALTVASGEEIVVDCEYNYNEIQALKEQVNNSSGGVYLHYLNIMPKNAMFNVDLFVTTSTPDQITTISQLAEIYGTYRAIACGFNGGSGNDFGYIMCNSTSAISTKSAVNNYTMSNVGVDSFTDTVKPV